MTSRKLTWFGLGFLVLAAIGFWGCSALPVTQGTLDDVVADQSAAAEAADSGNVLRTVFTGGSAFLGAVLLALGRLKAHDNKPFSGTVGGRVVTATEDEIVAAVEARRSEAPKT